MHTLKFLSSVVVALFFILSLPGCSIERMAIRSTISILKSTMLALEEEGDLKIAEQAAASDLKLLEGILKEDPDNDHLLLLAAKGFSTYAFGFAELDNMNRASGLYIRGRDYGIRILKKRNKIFADALSGSLEEFTGALSSFKKSDVPALFWTAQGWGGWIFSNLDSPNALVDLPRVRLLMNRVLELDETFYYGGAHIFFGVYHGARPRILGGDPEKAKHHFERSMEISEGRFLTAQLLYARYYAFPIGNRELFMGLIDRIQSAGPDLLPEQRLANRIAKEKARRLLEEAREYF